MVKRPFFSNAKKLLLIATTGTMISQGAFADRAILLQKDRDALQARVDIIQQAKSEILAEYFSVWNDDQSIGAMALLLNAAQKGIKVRVIVDALSNTIPKSIFAALQKLGKDKLGQQTLEVKVYNPLNLNISRATHRDHAKMLVVDGERLISGGRNVGDKYFGLNEDRNFNDLDVMADGQVVLQARDNFFKVWNSEIVLKPELAQFSDEKLGENGCLGQGDREHCEFVRQDAIKELKIAEERLRVSFDKISTKEDDDVVNNETHKDWLEGRESSVTAEFISQDPEVLNSKKNNTLTDRLAEILANSQSDVNIISPYLIPTPRLMSIFKELKERNVRIRIVTNSLKSTDNLFAQAGYRAAKKDLIALGIEIYEYNGPDTVHAKTAVIDGTIALIGTYNIDPRSANLNREIAIKLSDSNGNKMVNEQSAAIEVFRAKSTLVGKDKIEYNKETEFEGVSLKKKKYLKIVTILLPLIKSQL